MPHTALPLLLRSWTIAVRPILSVVVRRAKSLDAYRFIATFGATENALPPPLVALGMNTLAGLGESHGRPVV
jgi:hypothetical protein